MPCKCQIIMEDPISVFKILQDQFTDGLRNTMLEIEIMKHTIDGDSSFCTALTNSYQQKIRPLVNDLIKDCVDTHKSYTEVSMKLNDMAAQKDIYEKAYNIISSSYKEIGKQYMKLWNAVAISLQIAQSTIQMHKASYNSNLQLRKQYEDIAREKNILQKVVQFQESQMEEMLQNQDIINNSQIAFTTLQDAVNKHNERIQKEFEQQIQNLREENEKIQNSFHEKEQQNNKKIEELEKREKDLCSQIQSLQEEKTNLQNSLDAKNKELNQMSDVVSRNSTLEGAIQDFCQHFTFINFDGHKFECKLEDFTTENLSQFEHDNLRKQNAKLQQNNSELRRKISELRTSNEEQVKKLTQDHSDENRAKEHDITVLEKKISQLNRERNDLQSRLTDIQIDKKKADATISDLNDQLLSLKQRMQQTKNREEKINSRNEDREQHLSILNFRKTGPLVNMFAPSSNFGDSALKESNDLLRRQKQELEIKVSEMQSKISKLESMVAGNNIILELEEANKKIANLENQNKTFYMIKRKLKERIAELEDENKTLQEQQIQVNQDIHPPPDVENPQTIITTADQKEDEILNDENSEHEAQNEEQPPETPMPISDIMIQPQDIEQKPDEENEIQQEEEIIQQEEKAEPVQDAPVEEAEVEPKEEKLGPAQEEQIKEVNHPEEQPIEEVHEEAKEENQQEDQLKEETQEEANKEAQEEVKEEAKEENPVDEELKEEK